jgi:hypothetical protein
MKRFVAVPHKRDELQALPLREELEALVRYAHKLESQRSQLGPGSARRHLEDHLAAVRERFERLLEEWVPDPEVRLAWRAYLDHHAPEPGAPPPIRRLVFRGRGEASGSIVDVTGRGEELSVEVDGALVERVAGEKDFTSELPGLRWRLNGTEFEEIVDASPEALQALADFSAGGGEPPWEHAAALLADGLIDVHFELTPRGKRGLAASGLFP